jgi:hypothetical protein
MSAGEFVSGLIAMAYGVAALFFLRFWRDTHDRLFAFFTAAFALLAVQRTLLSVLPPVLEERPGLELTLYGLRALAFLVLDAGIVDKNRRD